jgi:uncharacterized protein YecT (DUF1311 family)
MAQEAAQVDCMNSATTQTELNLCAGEKLRQADTELNSVYKQLLAAAQKDRLAVAKIRTAQRAWLTFRDAQLEAVFPSKNKQVEYGSMYPMCDAGLATKMTLQRISELSRMLRQWGKGGPGCAFSVDPE